jgi:hypothetical protein
LILVESAAGGVIAFADNLFLLFRRGFFRLARSGFGNRFLGLFGFFCRRAAGLCGGALGGLFTFWLWP